MGDCDDIASSIAFAKTLNRTRDTLHDLAKALAAWNSVIGGCDPEWMISPRLLCGDLCIGQTLPVSKVLLGE